jgi:hypothetical protein
MMRARTWVWRFFGAVAIIATVAASACTSFKGDPSPGQTVPATQASFEKIMVQLHAQAPKLKGIPTSEFRILGWVNTAHSEVVLTSLDGAKLSGIDLAVIRRFASHLDSFFASSPTIPVTIDVAQPGLTKLRYAAALTKQRIHVVVITNRDDLLRVYSPIVGWVTEPNTPMYSAESVSYLWVTGDQYDAPTAAGVELCQGFVRVTTQPASVALIGHFWNAQNGGLRTQNLKLLHDSTDRIGQEVVCNTFGRALRVSLYKQATWQSYYELNHNNPVVQTDLINAGWNLTQAQFLSLRS